jgi:hypothetical protein
MIIEKATLEDLDFNCNIDSMVIRNQSRKNYLLNLL